MSTKKNTKTQKKTTGDKKELELTKTVIRSLLELKDHLGSEEFARRCEMLLRAIFESDGKEPAVKAKKRAQPTKAPKAVKSTRAVADVAKPNRPVAPKVTQEPPLPSSVRITDREMEIHLGSFGVKQLAEHDASELLGHPMVFWYRRGVFPDPRQSKVNPTVIEAKVVERKGKDFKGAPWTVHVKIGLAGDAVHCRSWAKGVLARNRGEQE